MASKAQFLASAAIAMILVLIAFIAGRAGSEVSPSTGKAPKVLLVGGAVFVLGSVFMSLAIMLEHIPPASNVAGMLLLLLTGCALSEKDARAPGVWPLSGKPWRQSRR